MELPFAGLHQLCAPMLARLDALPAPQGNALRVLGKRKVFGKLGISSRRDLTKALPASESELVPA